MTMSLVGPYLTTTNYKKRKQKTRTKNQQLAFEQQHREYNKSMKRMGCHDQMMSLEDYDLYVRGLYKPKLKGVSSMSERKPYQRDGRPWHLHRASQSHPTTSRYNRMGVDWFPTLLVSRL